MTHQLKIMLSDDCSYIVNFTSEKLKNKVEQLINDYPTIEAIPKIMKLRHKTTTPVDDFDNLKSCVNGLLTLYKNENGIR